MSLFEAFDGYDKPARVYLTLPGGSPWKTKDGKQAYVDVYSIKSTIEEQYVKTLPSKFKRPGYVMTPDEQSQNGRNRLKALTAGWFLPSPADDSETEFTPENVEKVYANSKLSFISEQLIPAIYEDVNFLEGMLSGKV